MVFQVPATPIPMYETRFFLHFGNKCKMDLPVQHSNTMYETLFFFILTLNVKWKSQSQQQSHILPSSSFLFPSPVSLLFFIPMAHLYTQFFSYFLSSSKFFSDCTPYVSWKKNFFFPCFSCHGVLIPMSSSSSKFYSIRFADCYHTQLCQFYS